LAERKRAGISVLARSVRNRESLLLSGIDRIREITYYNYRDKDFYMGSLAFPYFTL